jgi:hypothetical protein
MGLEIIRIREQVRHHKIRTTYLTSMGILTGIQTQMIFTRGWEKGGVEEGDEHRVISYSQREEVWCANVYT